ncbi:MAG: hypothetical protein H7239_08405 [Flavobacterium sp.]|nr:hypothetical protein [Flavobacterium sp.]
MKKNIFKLASIVLVVTSLTSCATVFGGKVSECQRTKPATGAPTRQVRVGALIADILLFWPGAIVDFATGAIYRPCNKK